MNDMIIAGYDYSNASQAATEWAAREAVLRGLSLQLLQAWPWSSGRPVEDGEAERRGREELAERAEQLRSVHPGLEVDVRQVPEGAVDQLVAASDRAAMLVLGSRGLGALRGFLVGSVSQRVLVHASCPVVLVRAIGEQREAPVPLDRGVVVGVDLAQPYDPVLEFAFDTAAAHQAPLTALHAWDPPAGTEYMHFGAIGGQEGEVASGDRNRLAEALEPWLENYPGLRVTARSERGHAGITLVDAAAEAGLLVVGTHHRRRGLLGTHLGAVDHAVLHHARCPVAVVPAH